MPAFPPPWRTGISFNQQNRTVEIAPWQRSYVGVVRHLRFWFVLLGTILEAFWRGSSFYSRSKHILGTHIVTFKLPDEAPSHDAKDKRSLPPFSKRKTIGTISVHLLEGQQEHILSFCDLLPLPNEHTPLVRTA